MIMANTTGQDVKALILGALKVPTEPGSVHDVKPSDFLSKSGQSIWKYPGGLVFRLEVDGPNRANALLRFIQPTDYEWSPDETILVMLWDELDLNAMLHRAAQAGLDRN
jgi:hypothetical protein